MAECAPSDQESEPSTSQNRLKYDRSFLLKLQWCAAARIKPRCLPNYPEVILDKPNFSDTQAEEHQEADLFVYTNNYKWTLRELSKPIVKTKKQIDRFSDVKLRDRSTSPMETTAKEKLDDKLDSNNLSFLQTTKVTTQDVEIYPDKIFNVEDRNLNVNDDQIENQRKEIPPVTFLDDRKHTEPVLEITYGFDINEMKSVEVLKSTDMNQTTIEQNGNKRLKETEFKDIDNLTIPEYDRSNLSDDSTKRKPTDMFHSDGAPNIRKIEHTKSKEKDKPVENDSFQERRREVFENEKATTLDFNPVESTREFTTETEIFCEPCEESHEKERAAHYCIECNDFLCEVCSQVHRKSKLSRHHQLLGKDEMPKEKVRGLDDGLCVKHNGELTRFYCQNHKQIICSVCVTLSHKNCNTDYIIDTANAFYESQEYRNLLTKLHDLTVTLQEQNTRSTLNADIMIDECARLVSEIEDFRSSFDWLLDSMEIAAKTKAREICQKGTTELRRTSTTCSKIEKQIYDINSNLQKLEKYQMKQPLFIAAKRVEETIKDYENTVAGLSELGKRKKIKFVPRKELIEVLHTLDMLGRIEIQSDENVDDADNNQKPAEQTGILERHIKSDSKIEKVALMSIVGVKAQRDVENCWITGYVKTNDDSLAVVDRNNTCVKIVSVGNNLITGYFKLFIPPWDITYTEARELVVTCAQIIFFIDLLTMKSTKEIKLGGFSYGIDYCQGKLFVTFDPPAPMLQILNTNGVVLKVIPVIKTGLPVVSRPIHISVADDGKTVAVSDNLQVVCFNTENMGDTSGISLKSLGIAFGFNMEVLFIDESSGNICLWRPDNPKEALVLFQTERPQSLAFCKKAGHLYVSHLGPKSNFLSVFKVL